MVWLAPIVGYVDAVGRLRCTECAEERHRDIAVSGEERFGKDDKCESCGWRFTHIPSAGYVQIDDGFPTPDFIRPRQAAE